MYQLLRRQVNIMSNLDLGLKDFFIKGEKRMGTVTITSDTTKEEYI